MKSKIPIIILSLLFFLLSIGILPSCGESLSVIPGHAHNDYNQEEPLVSALKNGFTSIEVDIFLNDGKLFVTHDSLPDYGGIKTIEQLYLNPLEEIIKANKGTVHKKCKKEFYLLIDVKSEAISTYRQLRRTLKPYRSILTKKSDLELNKGAITVVLSGNRAIEEILNQEESFIFIDGRPSDLYRKIPTIIMPMISDKFSNHITWRDELDSDEIIEFTSIIEESHKQGKIIRFWSTPENETAWTFLLEQKVDLINTDELEIFSRFYKRSQ